MVKAVICRLKEEFDKRNTSISIIGVCYATIIFFALIFYPLIPLILNYPPGTVNTEFNIQFNKINYTGQYLLIVFLVLFASHVYLRIILRDIDGWKNLLSENTSDSKKKINVIRKKCLSLPYRIYITQILVPNVFIIVIMSLPFIGLTFFDLTIIKIWILLFSFTTLGAVIMYIFSRQILTKVLLETYSGQEREIRKLGLHGKILLQLLPIFIVSILFTSLIGYSRLVKDKGDILYEYYNMQLSERFNDVERVNTTDQLLKILKDIEFNNPRDCAFVVTPERRVITSDGSPLSNFFLRYLFDLSDNYGGRVYDRYGVDIQGSTLKIKGERAEWIVGVKFVIASTETITFFLISFIALFGLNASVLSYFSKTLTNDISRVAKNLAEIAEGGNIDLDKKLAVTSNDEIGDLVVAFNKIQDLEKENINSMKEKQAILMEQERLASLGQLIGGIAHNLKTPIMSISGAVEGLKDLVEEYDESIDDEDVTKEDHHEIASDMMTWINKIKPHCSYMSDVITAVKGQAVQFNSSSSISFTLDELVKRIDILMKHELIKYNCTMNMDFQVDLKTELKGEVNNLVQIFDNIIINAIHAYEGKRGVIDFKIVRNGDNIEFIIADYGKGIPEEIKDKLFKEMVTTKGKNGTGLGLYMSYSTIKGRFGGNMWFTSREGKGTTFYVSIPCLKKAEANEEVV